MIGVPKLGTVYEQILFCIRAGAAIAALPHNLERAKGLVTGEDARRERAVADSVRDADALMAALKGKG